MPSTYDVIISGAGPAGATAGRKLARNGFSVLLLDKAAFPRDKLCGGAITPATYRFLDIDISSVRVKRCRKVRFDYRGERGHVYCAGRSYVDLVFRRDFDKLLLDKAVEAGVEFMPETATKDFTEHEAGVRVITSRGEFTGKCLVGADGALSPVARKLGFDREKSFVILQVQLPYAKAATEEEKDFLIFDCGIARSGYAWIFPKGNSVSAGIGSPGYAGTVLRKKLDVFLDCHRDLLDLSNVKVRGFWGPDFKGWCRPRASTKTLLIGDCARLMNPLSGEGIQNAVWSAQLAADFLSAHLHASGARINCLPFHRVLKDHMGKEVEKYLRIKKAFSAVPYFWYRLFLKKNVYRARRFLQPAAEG